MKTKLTITLLVLFLAFARQAHGQTPEIMDVSTVTVGAQHLETVFAFVVGKWSDDGNDVGVSSVNIHCYKHFGFCEVARGYPVGGQAFSSLDSFDILRWDGQEMIAVDSSPICLVNTLRFEFVSKKVSLSSASKGVKGNKFCEEIDKDPKAFSTVFLVGLKDVLEKVARDAKLARDAKKPTGK